MRREIALMIGTIALLGVSGMAQVSLDELGAIPGIEVTKINETSYLLTINSTVCPECLKGLMPFTCDADPGPGDCFIEGCPSTYPGCLMKNGNSVCCSKRVCNKGGKIYCTSGKC